QEGIVFRTVINVADGTLEDGSPAHPDDLERFEPWKNLFESTSIGQKVKRFHWIVNYELEKRFEEAKEALQAIPGMDAPSKELLLFHGTNPANINSILDNGFRIGGVGGQPVVNGTAMGYGVYLATHSATSVGYALGGDRIFACRVFPGKITGDYRYSQSPPKTTNPLDEPYHTYMQGGVYVVRYAALLVPCYVRIFC
ncbi:ADP-ribosylation, partial [Gymnopus androsaceus JB14]